MKNSSLLYFSTFVPECNLTVEGEIVCVDGTLSIVELYDDIPDCVSPLLVFSNAEAEDDFCSSQAGAYRFRREYEDEQAEKMQELWRHDMALG